MAEQYRGVPGVQGLQYPEAAALQAVNQAAGRTLSVQEIRAAHKQQSAEFQRLEQQLEQIRKDGDRLRGAGQWLEKYEAQQAQARKLFQSPKVKAQLKADMETSSGMMKDYGVTDRKDFERQVGAQQHAERGRGELQGEMMAMQPGLNLLQGAIRALSAAEGRHQNQQQRQEWARKHRGYTPGQDQEYER